MTAGDNFQNSDKIDSPSRANDFATKCSHEAWERSSADARFGHQKTDSSGTPEQSFLDFAANDPLLIAQGNETSTAPAELKTTAFVPTTSEQERKASTQNETHYYQSLFIRRGDREHGLAGRIDDPGHTAVQVEDTATGYKSPIVGLGPDKSVVFHPIKTKGSIHNDTKEVDFEMQVRREIPKENYDEMRKYVNGLSAKGNIGYSLLFPHQCTTEGIRMSSAGGWAIEAPKEKIAPFFPAQVTPKTLYEHFSRPQSIDLTNLDANGQPRPLEVFYLDKGSNNNRNYDAFEDR